MQFENKEKEFEEKVKELEMVTNQCNEWIDRNTKLAEELDSTNFLQRHPDEMDLEQEVRNMSHKISELNVELSRSQMAAAEAERVAKEGEEALKEAARKARDDWEAREEAQRKAGELDAALRGAQEDSLQLRVALANAEKKAETLQSRLHEALSEAERSLKAFKEAESTAAEQKRRLDEADETISGQASEISGLRSRLNTAQEKCQERLIEAQQKENACREANEQLKKAIDEGERQIKNMENEMLGLRKLLEGRTDAPKDLSSEDRALLDLLSMSMKQPAESLGLFLIDSLTAMILIRIPKKDSEVAIERVLQAVDKTGKNGELRVMFTEVIRSNWTSEYIKNAMLQGHYCSFTTASKVDLLSIREDKVNGEKSSEARKRQPTMEPNEFRVDLLGGWTLTDNGKRRKLSNRRPYQHRNFTEWHTGTTEVNAEAERQFFQHEPEVSMEEDEEL